MTEVEWLTYDGDPGELLTFPNHRHAARKLRLFACVCAQHIRHQVRDPRCLQALHTAERMADGEASVSERTAALESVHEVFLQVSPPLGSPEENAIVACRYPLVDSAIVSFAAANRAASTSVEKRAEQRWQSALFRCIFGNPFRPVTLDPSWRTEAVTALAQGIYIDRAFDRLPILADALQEAGCDNDDVLAHCRGDGPHARGCWVIDQLLGKA